MSNIMDMHSVNFSLVKRDVFVEIQRSIQSECPSNPVFTYDVTRFVV